ncbi:hypothetical protein OWM54_01125 [Myxococcus sp. MISCRS1]|uniref:hypothetical protein n=1 Tax=Myxococcus sp. MISCRS1 TaxID=2996786 RepID=UPI002271DB2C|nr:hypothetical protein [Myxococcus sp. MISCRS1]MCY0995730.1 hypothetical protein [Myxococcus sp. MISCRS1]
MARAKETDFLEANLAPLLERIHPEPHRLGDEPLPQFSESVHDVLHARGAIAGSPFADHVARLRKHLYGGPSTQELPPWSYEPQLARQVIREDPRVHGEQFEDRTRECSEIIENGCALLDHITQARLQGTPEGPPSRDELAWMVTVSGEDGLVREILQRARAGANRGRSTKSPEVSGCTHPLWQQTLSDHGLRGTASYPTISGALLAGLSSGEFGDWRQDYLATLIFAFYLEYNVDASDTRHNHFVRDLLFLWDVPDLPSELLARRTHQLADLAFIDGKRKSEAALRSVPTSGMKAWIFGDRDLWRDFKACDSAMFGHYLSSVPGTIGRDELMLTGLVQDWVDLGPDLRNDECAQSVLTLTRGSVSTTSLVECYERTLWQLNAALTRDGGLKPERFPLMVVMMDVGVWHVTNHRHDIWRYFALAHGTGALLQDRDLYKACQLADCYSPRFEPTLPSDPARVNVPRRPFRYDVTVAGRRHSGSLELHVTLVDAVENGLMPTESVEHFLVIPRLLVQRAISPGEFLAHMDQHACEQHALIVRAGYRCHFSRQFTTARILLVMEQWWSGIIFAVGLGSLIEAQPGRMAQDRLHHDG